MDQFLLDHGVNDTIDRLCGWVAHYQSKLTGIKSADPALKLSYDQLIDHFSAIRPNQLWYPYLGTGMGRGALVELADGSVKYDMISGIGSHFSHGDPKIVKALVQAACQTMVMQGNLQQNRESEQLLSRFCDISGMDCGILTTSGVMAVENALKIVFQYQYPKSRLLAFEKCFAGRTLAVSHITDKPHYRDGLPHTLAVDYIPFYDYRDPQGSMDRTLTVLHDHLLRYPGQYAMMCMELIQGEGGYYPGTSDFFKAIMEVLRAHDVLIFVDEIQTFGRTSSFFAYQWLNLDSMVDIVTVGKLSQVCATLFNAELKPRAGLVSQTFTGSTGAIHASLVILDELEKTCLGQDGKSCLVRDQFLSHFKQLESDFGADFSGPYGCGCMIAFTPFQGDSERVLELVRRLYDAGVIGFICGQLPMRIRFLPPIGGVSMADIDEVMLVVKEVIEEMVVETRGVENS
jgi:acetylornithine/N-succinyldiaminopimelate aminotransferase